MDVKSFRAKSMPEALRLVRRELGPDASVLHTREVRSGLLRWLGGGRQVEIVATASVRVPSRLPQRLQNTTAAHSTNNEVDNDFESGDDAGSSTIEAADRHDYRAQFRHDLKNQLDELHSLVEDLCSQSEGNSHLPLPDSLFQLYTELLDNEVCDELARDLIDRVRTSVSPLDLSEPMILKARLARLVEDEFDIHGPIQLTPGIRRVVALVGPTGVGKTTTAAKLAANFRLRDQRRVGLITVDTYRIAAVEQLRTYADIMDLPMEIVSTPREMRTALQRLSHLDLVLMDTAGRSPRDEVQIQELRSMLGEAQPDEVHLVLSTVASAAQMKKTAETFARVGANSLLLTKLDEATGLGNLLPLVRGCRLPISYLTNGQNVPNDIEPADRRQLARMVLGMAIERKTKL